MASIPLGADSARINRAPTPPAAVSRILSRFDRADLEGFISVAISLLDCADGDSDFESLGAEDDFEIPTTSLAYAAGGAGCDIADSADETWIEWDKMPPANKRGPNVTGGFDDAEDDDPAGQYDEDQYTARALLNREGAGCPISDPGGCEHDGREHDMGV